MLIVYVSWFLSFRCIELTFQKLSLPTIELSLKVRVSIVDVLINKWQMLRELNAIWQSGFCNGIAYVLKSWLADLLVCNLNC